MVESRAAQRGTRSALARLGWGVLALMAGGGLAAFVVAHPLGVLPMLAGVVVILAILAWRGDAWLVILPGLLPVVDLTPWTGNIDWTESDALVLAVLASAAFREALARHPPPMSAQWQFGLVPLGLVLLMAASYLVSTDWQPLAELVSPTALSAGYDSALNGVRVSKGMLWAMLLLPVLAVAFRRYPETAARRLGGGLLLGLMLVTAAVFWERLAFPGLSDFGSDYRTTALFWEMHVGGAQLDGWLAMSFPFLLAWVLREQAPLRLLTAAALLALVAYALFTTFSRGLYAAVALSTLVLLVTVRGQRNGEALAVKGGPWNGVIWVAWIGMGCVIALATAAVFRTGGYRGMAAVLGFAGCVYLAGPAVVRVSWRQGLLALVPLTVLALISMVLLTSVARGPYLAFALSVLATLALAVAATRWPGATAGPALGILLWAALNTVLVPLHWGGGEALVPSLLAVVACMLPLLSARFYVAMQWQPALRQGVMLAVIGGAVALLAVTFNTYYSVSRLDTVSQDLAGRKLHWARGIGLVAPDQAAFGIGVGRYASSYFWQANTQDIPGNHRLEPESDNIVLRLGGPRHTLGFGELYRVLQRIDGDLALPLTLTFRARAPEAAAVVHVEVCRRHLLYVQGCGTLEVRVPAGGEWQRLKVILNQPGMAGAPGFPPRLTAFAVANGSRGRVVDLDDLSLIDAYGRELLNNGNFTQGNLRWFFSSDRHHLPWHAKSLPLHFWIEQGWFGLVAIGLLVAAAVFRLSVGNARRHGLAAPLLAGLAGFFVVGVFDSLVDAPRLGLLMFLMLFVALGIRGRPSA